MDKIKYRNGDKFDSRTLLRSVLKINELVEGYNEIMKRLDKRDEGIHKMVKRIKHDLYDDK